MNVNICYIFQGAHVSQVVKAALETWKLNGENL